MGILKNIIDKISKPKPVPKIEEVTKECDLLISKRRYKQKVHNTKGAFGNPKFRRDLE